MTSLELITAIKQEYPTFNDRMRLVVEKQLILDNPEELKQLAKQEFNGDIEKAKKGLNTLILAIKLID